MLKCIWEEGLSPQGTKMKHFSFALETVLRLPKSANFWKWAPEWKVLFLSKLYLFKKGHLPCMCTALLGKGSMCTSVATTSNVCAANCAKIGIASPKICICCVHALTLCYIRRGLYLQPSMLALGFSVMIGDPCERTPFSHRLRVNRALLKITNFSHFWFQWCHVNVAQVSVWNKWIISYRVVSWLAHPPTCLEVTETFRFINS